MSYVISDQSVITQNGHTPIEEDEDEEEEVEVQMSKAILKEGILEKKGHSTAFFTWPK